MESKKICIVKNGLIQSSELDKDLLKWKERVEKFVFSSSFPCIGAQKLFRSFEYGIIMCGKKFLDESIAEDLCNSIYEAQRTMQYGEVSKEQSLNFRSLIILFPNEVFENEEDAEKKLWQLYGSIHNYDKEYFEWDSSVEKNVYDPSFGMSIGGIAHFTPLLHPSASSLVRQFEIPMLVLNPHFIFRQLRESKLFDSWRDIIREKEKQAQLGWINPKLSDHGIGSEASQYALTKNPVFNIGDCPFTGKKLLYKKNEFKNTQNNS